MRLQEVEEEFYKAFEVIPKVEDACKVEDKYWEDESLQNWYGAFDTYMDIKCGNQENCSLDCPCAYDKYCYKELTDLVYLELACMLINEASPLTFIKGFKDLKVKNLKNLILKSCIEIKDKIKDRVKALLDWED